MADNNRGEKGRSESNDRAEGIGGPGGDDTGVQDAVIDKTTTRDGLDQLRRRWAAETPRSAVLLVHGLGEHSGRYDHVGRFLAERGHDVVAFDNRGFGKSGGRRGHVDRFDQFLDDVEDGLAERAELGVPVVLLGHSLGGLIVGNYLVSSRPQPDLAVLSAPAFDAESERWQRVAAPILGRIAPRLFVPSEIDPSALTSDLEVQQAYADDPLRVAGVTARMGDEVFRAMARVNENLDRLRVPTYVLHGDEDVVVPPQASAPLADLAGVTHRTWSGLRHESFNEPEWPEVLGEVDQWLQAQLSGAGTGPQPDAD